MFETCRIISNSQIMSSLDMFVSIWIRGFRTSKQALTCLLKRINSHHTYKSRHIQFFEWRELIWLHHFVSELWFDIVLILGILRIQTIECFEHIENWLVASGAFYRAILDSILLSLIQDRKKENEGWNSWKITVFTLRILSPKYTM